MGVALGGALDDHKEAVEGSARLAQEQAAASRQTRKEGGEGDSGGAVGLEHKHVISRYCVLVVLSRLFTKK